MQISASPPVLTTGFPSRGFVVLVGREVENAVGDTAKGGGCLFAAEGNPKFGFGHSG